MTLATLEDVRALVHKHLPTEYCAKDTWQRVATITTAAARGELPPSGGLFWRSLSQRQSCSAFMHSAGRDRSTGISTTTKAMGRPRSSAP